MDFVLSPLDLVTRGAPEGPVAIARPHRVHAAAEWFQSHFPGEIYYAVKANPSPWVLDALWRAGITKFDVASEAEAELVAARFPKAELAFMHPVKSRRAIQRAFFDFGIKTFALDSEAELEKILAETGGAKNLNLMVRLAVAADGAAYPLTRKFGVEPQVFYDVMTDGLFASSAYKVYGKIIAEESYATVGQMAVLGLKDANLALAAGEAAGVPLPSGNVWRDRLVGAIAHGDGGKDWAVMALEQARASGLS